MSHRHLRVAPWQGDPKTVLVGPARGRRPPNPRDIRECLERLRERGVKVGVTPALSPYEAEPFYQAGFELHERLYLLAKDLSEQDGDNDRDGGDNYRDDGDHNRDRDGVRQTLAAPAGLSLTTARRWHRSKMLDVDRRAFQGFWQFDAVSLTEALNATPYYWARLAYLNGVTVGYAVTGRASDRGYLQRLAVIPEAQGQGVGSSLVNDAITWLRGRRSTLALVNTQEINTRAFDLYQRHGFVRQSQGLIVLRWST